MASIDKIKKKLGQHAYSISNLAFRLENVENVLRSLDSEGPEPDPFLDKKIYGLDRTFMVKESQWTKLQNIAAAARDYCRFQGNLPVRPDEHGRSEYNAWSKFDDIIRNNS